MFRRWTYTIVCLLSFLVFGLSSMPEACSHGHLSSERWHILGMDAQILAETPHPLGSPTLHSTLGLSLTHLLPAPRFIGRWPIPIEAVSSKGFMAESLSHCICGHSVASQIRPWLFYGIKEHRIRV